MKTPVCDICIKSGQLCEQCSKKVADGRITLLDFEVAQILARINERINISNAEFYKALDLGRVVLVLTRGEVGLLIGKDGKVVSELSSALGRKVRIAEVRGDVKKSIADIIMPARLLGINSMYHEGREIVKVRIAKSDLAHLPLDLPTLEKALCALMEREVKLSVE